MGEWATDKLDELQEQVTILKAERDEFKRQRDEALGDLSVAVDGWEGWMRQAYSGEVIEAELTKIDELRRKHHLS